MEQLKLKPCPFCGGRAELKGGDFIPEPQIDSTGVYIGMGVTPDCEISPAFVECTNCHAYGPDFDEAEDAIEKAVEAWNARTDNDTDATKVPALLAFVRQEVPFRLENIFNIPSEKITPNIVDVCVWSLYDNSDVMFDYDSMDDHLREVLKEYDIDPDDYEDEKENGKD